MKKFISVEQIKKERKLHRGNDTVYMLIGTILGELDRLPIPRTEQPSEQDIYKVIKKLYEAAKEINSPEEIKFLEDYIIKVMSEDELEEVIGKMIMSKDKKPNIGSIMQELKSKYPNQYDGKLASIIIKEILEKY